MAFCHEKTRTSEPLYVLESGDALLARCRMQPCSVQDIPLQRVLWITMDRWMVIMRGAWGLSRKVAGDERDWFDSSLFTQD